jgi:hypothetical protein
MRRDLKPDLRPAQRLSAAFVARVRQDGLKL